MSKSKRYNWIIRAWMATVIFGISLNVSIQYAKEVPEIVIQKGHSGGINSVAISQDGKYIASGSDDKTIRLWDVKTGKEIRTFVGHTAVVTSVALNGNGQTLASSTSKSLGVIKKWILKVFSRNWTTAMTKS